MAYEAGDLKVFNPSKEISKEIILEILIRHRDALKQARTGELKDQQIEEIKDNQRKINQVRALSLIISAQREMITASRPIIHFRSVQKWKKKNKEDEDREKNPFKEDKNDYNELIKWLNFLKQCTVDILTAERTKTKKDDFLIIENTNEGEFYKLTNNFFDMLDDLETSYEQIYLLMLINKIVSAGIEEDEEKTYKEKEQEAIRRIVDA